MTPKRKAEIRAAVVASAGKHGPECDGYGYDCAKCHADNDADDHRVELLAEVERLRRGAEDAGRGGGLMRPLVLYHASCPDGFCAAWVARLRLGGEADYVPAQYGQEPPHVSTLSGRRVWIVDFSYKRPLLAAMAQACNRIVVLDHHKTAQAELAGLEAPGLSVTFDMGKSGGRLTWEHFFPGERAPWLVDYTEDRDLWRWKLPNSREVSAAIASHPHDFALWDRWAMNANGGNATPTLLAEEGRAILRYQGQQVEAICATAREVELDGYRVLAANTPIMISEVAGRLADGRPFGASWFVRSDGKKQWSLRSRENGVDVSEVARKRGGGGHHSAAGFEEAI